MFPCPCCGYLTLPNKPPGTLDGCPVCSWVDDQIQYENPSSESGCNSVSLETARKNYVSFGAISREELKNVRLPKDYENPLYEQIRTTIPYGFPEIILKDAKSLGKTEPYLVAWTKGTINKMMSLLEGTNIVIAGGDVYQVKCGEIYPVYSSWSCGKRDYAKGETIEEYAHRTREETLNFVNSYEDPGDGTVLYNIIFSTLTH